MILSSTDPRNWSPKCYYNQHELLILEDILPLNYQHLPERQYFTDAHLEQALRCLARFHCSSILHELRTNGAGSIQSDHGDYLEEKVFHRNNPWYVVGMEAIISLAAQRITASANSPKWAVKFNAEKLREELLFVVPDLIERPSRRYRNVLCHRDIWNNNVMFQYGVNDPTHCEPPTHAILIDYQICRYMPPAFDLLQLLHLNRRRDVRNRANVERHLRFYHDNLLAELTAEGGTTQTTAASIVPWSDLVESFAAYKLYGLTNNCLYNPAVKMPDNALIVLRATDPTRYELISNVRRDQFLLEWMEKDAEYAAVVWECVEELCEHVFGV